MSKFSNLFIGFAGLRHFDHPLQPVIIGFKFYQGENEPTKEREVMRGIHTTITVILFAFLSSMHLLRLVPGWDLSIGGTVIPM